MPGLVYRLRLSTPPPSVNRMWRNTAQGTKLSAEGRAWKATAVLELNTQRGLRGPCYWRADILVPGTSKIDLDNHLKGILDALHEAGKSPDDRYLVDLRIRFHGGDAVEIALKKETLSKWSIIKKASRSVIRKLAKSSL